MSFSKDYQQARDNFRTANAAAGRRTGSADLVDGLTIDWTWAGPERTPQGNVIVFTSALHGVEGFGGSAVQLDLLTRSLDVPTLIVHVLNPWGMANYRRFNENNVDLNRNFLAPGVEYSTNDPTYAALDGLLNPESPPGGVELFWPNVAWVVARHGYQALKNAVVGGQHQNPKGIFFGGHRLERGPELLLAMLDEQLDDCARVVHVDLHSGLGAFGGRTVLLDGEADPARLSRARAAFGVEVKGWDPSNLQAYEIRGGLLEELGRRAAIKARPTRYDGFTCEFGTLSNLAVLARVRAENRLHHWGTLAPGSIDHWAKMGMREAFAPLDASWEASVLAHGPALYTAAKAMLVS
ncbi:MAG: DUF2817 domain-containing protein [Myxococcales bacterium]|nr:DUF2817 domain-containing protein [Myxococcales bacterium]